MLKYCFNFLCSYFVAYTKAFQWICLDYGWLSFKCFLSNAPYIDSDIDYNELNLIEVLLPGIEINYVPVNSGTISIIFKAKLNNEELVIKVLRCGIEKKLKSALSNLKFIFTTIRLKTLAKIIENISDKILEQVDFDLEYNNINLVKQSLRKYACAETVTPMLKTNKAIVMTYIDGKFLHELSLEDKRKFTEVFVKTNNFLLLKKMVYHLDLHPGNILFIKKDGKYKIAFLDMGMIYKMNIKEVNIVLELMFCAYCKSSEESVYDFFNNNKDDIFDGELPSGFKKFIVKNKIFKEKSASSISKNLIHILGHFKSNRIVIKANMNKLLIGLISFLGTFSLLDECGNFQKILEENLIAKNGK